MTKEIASDIIDLSKEREVDKMKVNIKKAVAIDFKELAAWIIERGDLYDIADHIADENGIDYTNSNDIADQIEENIDEFWDNLYKAIIEYCKEHL